MIIDVSRGMDVEVGQRSVTCIRDKDESPESIEFGVIAVADVEFAFRRADVEVNDAVDVLDEFTVGIQVEVMDQRLQHLAILDATISIVDKAQTKTKQSYSLLQRGVKSAPVHRGSFYL
jgi:hypothetical protein